MSDEYFTIPKSIGDNLMNDIKRLDWMIFHSASIHHSKDTDCCWVRWPDDKGWYKQTPVMGDSRECIDKAIKMSKE